MMQIFYLILVSLYSMCESKDVCKLDSKHLFCSSRLKIMCGKLFGPDEKIESSSIIIKAVNNLRSAIAHGEDAEGHDMQHLKASNMNLLVSPNHKLLYYWESLAPCIYI